MPWHKQGRPSCAYPAQHRAERGPAVLAVVRHDCGEAARVCAEIEWVIATHRQHGLASTRGLRHPCALPQVRPPRWARRPLPTLRGRQPLKLASVAVFPVRALCPSGLASCRSAQRVWRSAAESSSQGRRAIVDTHPPHPCSSRGIPCDRRGHAGTGGPTGSGSPAGRLPAMGTPPSAHWSPCSSQSCMPAQPPTIPATPSHTPRVREAPPGQHRRSRTGAGWARAAPCVAVPRERLWRDSSNSAAVLPVVHSQAPVRDRRGSAAVLPLIALFERTLARSESMRDPATTWAPAARAAAPCGQLAATNGAHCRALACCGV